MLGENDVEVAGERQVAAHEDAQADNDGKPELLRMGIADAEREAGAVHPLVERHHAEEVLAVLRHGVFFGGDRDMPEPKLFFEGVHDLDRSTEHTSELQSL